MKRLFAYTVALAIAALGGEAPGGIIKRSSAPRPIPVAPTVPPTEATDTRPLLWVVDGAGDLRGCSNALSQTNILAGNPVELSVFAWSHGYRRLLLDQVDTIHAKSQGARLAAKIQQRAKEEPGRRVVVVAHSAGCAVALAAGDCLPADSIDRMILLAPSVSTKYDLRSSLAAAREGIDVFCSKKDWVALGVCTRLVGTTDQGRVPAAGRHGFRVAEPDRLRQHFWSSELAWTGNTGGHYGTHSPAFLQVYVFPLIGTGVK